MRKSRWMTRVWSSQHRFRRWLKKSGRSIALVGSKLRRSRHFPQKKQRILPQLQLRFRFAPPRGLSLAASNGSASQAAVPGH